MSINNNINPKIWGSAGWKFLHAITLAYPENPSYVTKESCKKLFSALQDLLPCSLCQDNYKQHITTVQLTDKILSSRANLVMWLLKIRNETRKQMGRGELTSDDVFDEVYGNCFSYSYYIYILLIIILILVVILIYYTLLN